MDANLDYRIYHTNDKQEISENWRADVERSRREDGTDYSGAIGTLGGSIHWQVGVHKTLKEAIEYIDNNHEKGDIAMAVPFLIASNRHCKRNGQVGYVLGGLCPE